MSHTCFLVGHFAFVHEEIVQRQVNFKIGKRLGDELALDRESHTDCEVKKLPRAS
ncbi:MAG: hypothetical protein AAGK10_14375 [Cyanobacteria bacterium J06555_3]